MADIKWQVRPQVKIASVEATQIVFARLGQRIAVKTEVAGQLPEILKFLEAPRTQDEVWQTLQARDEWSLEALESLLSGLKEKGILLSDPFLGGLQAADVQWPWAPIQNLSLQTQAAWQENQKKWDAIKGVQLITRMQVPENFMAPLKVAVAGPTTDAIRNTAEGILSILFLSSTDYLTLEGLAQPVLDANALQLLVLADPAGAIVGPLVGGRGRPCLNCISRRLRASASGGSRLAPLSPALADEIVFGWPFTFWRRLESILLDEIFKLQGWIGPSFLQRGAYIFDFINHRSETDEVFPVPGCFCNDFYKTQFQEP